MKYFRMKDPLSNSCYRTFYILKQLITDDIKASKQYKSLIKKLMNLANEIIPNGWNAYKTESKLKEYLGETVSTLLTYEYFKPIEDLETDIDIDDIETIEHINWFGDGDRGIEYRKRNIEAFRLHPEMYGEQPEKETEEYFAKVFGKADKRNVCFILD